MGLELRDLCGTAHIIGVPGITERELSDRLAWGLEAWVDIPETRSEPDNLGCDGIGCDGCEGCL